MKSLKELLISGPGPSSSHTIGPFRICKRFMEENQGKEVNEYVITLYGSLALTGKGHSTDEIILDAFKPNKCTVLFQPSFNGLRHPNTMDCKAIYKDGSSLTRRFLSVGGGAYVEEGEAYKGNNCYPFSTFDGLKSFMKQKQIDDIYEVIKMLDSEDIFEYGKKMLKQSFKTVEDSLQKEGILPGPLQLDRVAKKVYLSSKRISDKAERRTLMLTAYAYATSEANANHEMMVTAPTCGAAGVVPSCLYYEYKNHHATMEQLVKAYLVGALICNFIKENASVSGALLGCQAEIGSAASFAAASLSYLHALSVFQIEYASEVAMEHFLGLTCDPVDGYVQIPCIERNAIASIHAYTSYLFAQDIALFRRNKVSFDNVIQAMKETGKVLPVELKETSLGGLAKIIC